ncbi:hypothetical protein CMI42_02550 [Candidatus Pacearchaeota archaeon]|jgi:hypothetical protein|nr:hypothetical protein [Candidatus Pacearchaeota archaeon]|tara:strand:- start:193 stop:414 length:222 start_codon:yes stop_codon:yes gene_type:complete
MKEILVKLDIPSEFEDAFEAALEKALTKVSKEIQFSIADEILKNSEFTEGDANRLGEQAKQNRLNELKSKDII